MWLAPLLFGGVFGLSKDTVVRPTFLKGPVGMGLSQILCSGLVTSGIGILARYDCCRSGFRERETVGRGRTGRGLVFLSAVALAPIMLLCFFV
jgi:hypothetical protein